MKCVVILICFVCTFAATSQNTKDSLMVADTSYSIKPKKDRRPRNATILSAIIPGAGQIYNRKYWKTPIVWAGLGAVGYYFMQNQTLYTQFRNDVKALVKGDSAAVVNAQYSLDQLQSQKITYRKRRDLFGFGVIAVYALQVIDANVDAHLRTFDVSDDLSLELHAKPVYTGMALGAGISLKLTIK